MVTDVIPSGLMIESLDAPGWTCPLSTTVEFRCELPTLAPGDAPPITIVASVGSGVPAGALINTGRVTTTSPDRNPQNNADDAVITIVTNADLGITKVHPVDPADPIVAGGDIEFEMRVVNNGPSDALAVVIEDRMPAGFSYVSSRGPWDCQLTPASDPDVVQCTYLPGRLIGGTPATPTIAEPLFITAAIDSTLDTGTYVNVAEVSSDTPDGNPDNDIAEDPVVVGTLADLTITKTHPAGSVRIGEELVFTLQVENFGPSEARDVIVTDTIPAGLTLVSAAGAGTPTTWDCTATVAPDVDCRLTGPLAAGADAEPILVTVLVTPAAFPSVSNTAVVASVTPEPDPDPNPNTSTDVVDVPRLVDLFITKTHAGPVGVGQPIVYTLTVGNNGPIDDDAVITITDPIPASLRATAATSAAAECRISDNVVTCTKNDGLAVGATFTITITADVLPAAYPSVTNTATVSSPTDDSNPLNNTASDVATVPPLVDLAITKTHTGEVKVGGQITYTVTVRNNGPTPDPGPVRMLDTLPGSLNPVSATADGMNCTITGQTVACQALAPLAVGAQLVITIVADVGPGAFPSVSNTAIVTTPGCVVGPGAGTDPACPDTNLDNNTATDVATVAPLVLLGVQKTLASLEASTATWSIVVTNLGSNTTVDPIRMTDNLPSTLAYVSAGGDGWLCTNIGQVVGCTYSGPLAPGASTPPISIVTLVNAPEGSSITNVATVDGGGPGVPSVTDDGNVIAPVRPPLPTTGGDIGVLLQWAPLLMLLGLALVIAAKRRRTHPAT